MWDLVSFMLGLVVFMFIMNYMFEPQKIIEDLKSMKGSNAKIEALEKRVEELERTVKTIKNKEL